MHGKGVYAVVDLAEGETLIEYVGEVITWEEALNRHPHDPTDPNHTFYFHIDEEHVIDAKHGGNSSRWINHSCKPNCEAEIEDDRVFIRAKKEHRGGQRAVLRLRPGDRRAPHARSCSSSTPAGVARKNAGAPCWHRRKRPRRPRRPSWAEPRSPDRGRPGWPNRPKINTFGYIAGSKAGPPRVALAHHPRDAMSTPPASSTPRHRLTALRRALTGLAWASCTSLLLSGCMTAAHIAQDLDNQARVSETKQGIALLRAHIARLQAAGDPLGDYYYALGNSDGWITDVSDPKAITALFEKAAAKGSMDAKILLALQLAIG